MNPEFSYSVPTLLFPTISLFFLSFTNRFVAMSQLTRNLHDQYKNLPAKETLLEIKNMKFRLKLIKNMQILAIFSLILAAFCIVFLFVEKPELAKFSFGFSLLLLIVALGLSAWEITISTTALEIKLGDIEELNLRNK